MEHAIPDLLISEKVNKREFESIIVSPFFSMPPSIAWFRYTV